MNKSSVSFGKKKLPGIGMRIIKSAVAVSLCLVVNLLRGDSGIVFYSMLAALWCIQVYRDNTWKNALQRTIGTLVGAIYGLIYLLTYPSLVSVTGSHLWVDAACLFIGIIIVIYTTVLLRKNYAAYFSCVVFLSIVINHISDMNPYLFVLNRFLDTMIGICIGVAVNNFRICLHPDRSTLFVSGVDDILVDKNDKISAFSKVEINRLIENGMRFTISTMRTPASLLEPLSDVHLQYPVIVMDGAALYDVRRNEYIKEYVISPQTAGEVSARLKKSGLCVYVNVIIDDTLLIYYQKAQDEVNRELVRKLKVSPFRNYLQREYPCDENVVYFMILDRTDQVNALYDELAGEGYESKFKIVKYESDKYAGYSYMKIYNRNASKENMLLYLKEKYDIKDSLTFGTVPGKYDVLVHDQSFNEMVRIVRKKYEKHFF